MTREEWRRLVDQSIADGLIVGFIFGGGFIALGFMLR